jgi:hypothetical protein
MAKLPLVFPQLSWFPRKGLNRGNVRAGMEGSEEAGAEVPQQRSPTHEAKFVFKVWPLEPIDSRGGPSLPFFRPGVTLLPHVLGHWHSMTGPCAGPPAFLPLSFQELTPSSSGDAPFLL